MPVLTKAAGLVSGTVLLLALAANGHAQDRLHLAPVRVATAPVIDGRIDPDEWANASVEGGFTQYSPVVGAAPGERTQLLMMYDADHLYVAVKSYDRTPAGIRATVMERDGDLAGDDHVALILDPLSSRRNGYRFAMNPLGAREDGLIENNAAFRKEWDAIWRGRSSLTADGWVAEFAIPFRQLAINDNGTPWGLQVIRKIQRGNESVRLAALDVTLLETDLTRIAALDGIRDVRTGRGIEVQLYGAVDRQDLQATGEETAFRPGGSISVRLTPSLTSTLAIRPDFSDAPLDPRQVNTGRFDLFIPETRDFFLKDAGAFEFGGRPLAEDPNGRPFFSRRIGLSDDKAVDIDAGVKLSGALGRTSIGALAVQTEEALPGEGKPFLGVARVARPALAESQIGGIVTYGDPLGLADASVMGVDFQYRNSRLFDDGYLAIDSYGLLSRNDDVTGHHVGTEIRMEREASYGFIRFKEVGQDFSAPLGFVNRTGIRRYYFEYGLVQRPKDSPLQMRYSGVWYLPITDLSGRLLSDEIGAYTYHEFRTQDNVTVDSKWRYERVTDAFDLPKGIRVPAGDYRYTTASVALVSSAARPISGNLKIICCEFYDGKQLSVTAGLTLRTSRRFSASVSATRDRLDMPAGQVTIKILTLQGRYNFSPDMTAALQIQHDNISQQIGALASWRWEPLPGQEWLVTLGQTADSDYRLIPSRWQGRDSTLTIRYGRTLQF